MNYNLKKILTNDYFQIVSGVLIGIILTIIFIDENTILGLIGDFFILINIIRLMNVTNGKKDDLKTLLINIILGPVILGLLIGFFAGEFKHLKYTLNRSQIINVFGGLGFILALLISFFKYFKKDNGKRRIKFLSIIASIILLPLTFISCAIFINRLRVKKTIKITKSIVYQKKRKIDETDLNYKRSFILTYINQEKEILNIEHEIWNKLQVNDTILVYSKKGNLGYDIVESVEKKPTANTM